MAEMTQDRLRSLYANLAEGAREAGEPVPAEERVRALGALLVHSAVEIPADLTLSLRTALEAAAVQHVPVGAQRPMPGLRSLLRLLWAEARFLPLSFFALQAVLLAVAFLASRYLTGVGGPRLPAAGSGEALNGDLVARALLRDALGRSVDAFTLVAPWVGAAAVVVGVVPGRRGLWGDLESLSPLSASTRLLARTAAATFIATVAMLVAGAVHPGPSGVPAALLLLARAAPLLLAVSWALAWSIPFGAPGAALASFILWGGLTWFGDGLGRWDLFAPPGTAGVAWTQALALMVAAGLFAFAWRQMAHRELQRGRLS